MYPIPITPKLTLIPLPLPLQGFKHFISAWLFQGEKTLLLDPGPTSTVPVLLETLAVLKVQSLDAVLLTHIHLDHAGGLGDFFERFGEVPVVLHKSGIKHLTAPERLWEASLKTIPETARVYGPPKPVKTDLLHDAARYEIPGVEPFFTPGHAAHHISYRIGPYLFAGETAGVFAALSGDRFYLRPATPPPFFYEQQMQSIQILRGIGHTHLCVGHFGAAPADLKLLDAHVQQTQTWRKEIAAEMQNGAGDRLLERCLVRLLKVDPCIACWNDLPAGIQVRERFFLKNSITGFIGDITDRP